MSSDAPAVKGTASLESQPSVIYHKEHEATEAILAAEVHQDDAALVAAGMDADVVKALRHRRDEHFANEITGAVGSGQLSLCMIMSYAPPSLTTVPLTLLISVYVIQFYEKIGASLGLLAFFQALARAFDVVTDPTMSYISDSCRHPQGRRRPFLFCGAPLYCACLIGLLFPQPSLSEFGVSCWFGFFYIAFFLFATFCNIPYDALGPELTDNQDDRTKLFFACTMFDGLGALCAAMLPVSVGVYMSGIRSTNRFTYTSCDVPGNYDWVPYNKGDDMSTVVRPAGRIDALSSSGPWGAGHTQPPPDIRAWTADVQVDEAYIKSFFDLSNCPLADGAVVASASFAGKVASHDEDLASWCECHNKADVSHGLDTLRYAYFWTGLFFGMWAFLSLWNLVFNVRERSQMKGAKALPKPAPFVPSILGTFSNKPFMLLLPAWVLDSLASAIIGSLLTFFVRYIVMPEYANQDEPEDGGYGCRPVGGSGDWKCDSSKVVGMSVMALLFGAFAATPFWLFAAKKFGKRTTWLAWSLSNGLTFLCYAPIGKGDVWPCIIMSVFNGAPISAKFLADAIMADVIDYDEFLTGSRSEATYTMFKGFLPKIAAIPASAVPIVLLSTFGHKPPINGVVQLQDEGVRLFIRIVIIYIPAVLAFGAFLVKLKYPLRTKEDCELISQGIATHMLSKPAVDPVTGKEFTPVHFAEKEKASVNLINAFRGFDIVDRLMKDWDTGSAYVEAMCRKQLLMAVAWFITWAIVTASTFFLLMSTDPDLEMFQFIPVLSIVCFGVGITACGFTFLRLQSAKALKAHKCSVKVLKKLKKSRQSLLDLADFEATVRGGWTTKSIREVQSSTIGGKSVRTVNVRASAKIAPGSDAAADDAPESKKSAEEAEYNL